MIWFFICCILFVFLVIITTVVLARRAKKEVMARFGLDIHGRPKTLWEEEEEDNTYCVM